jgi:hypothetical protein
MSSNIEEIKPAEPRSTISPAGTIMLPDGEFKLRIDFNALAEIEEVTGTNMMAPTAFQNLSCSRIRTILWILHPARDAAGHRNPDRQEHLSRQSFPRAKDHHRIWVRAMPKKEGALRRKSPFAVTIGRRRPHFDWMGVWSFGTSIHGLGLPRRRSVEAIPQAVRRTRRSMERRRA